MTRPGFFIFPVHEPTLCRELIRDTQPSLAGWASVTSAGQLQDRKYTSPNTIFPRDGDIGHSSTKHQLDDIPTLGGTTAPSGPAAGPGLRQPVDTHTKPPIWYGHDYRARLRPHGQGFGGGAWLRTQPVHLQLQRVVPQPALTPRTGAARPAATAMRAGDYLGLHGIGAVSPLDLGALLRR